MDEIVEILTENGELTGNTINKLKAHKEGICHGIGAVGIINTKGELLIQKRSFLKKNEPNKWDITSAGHISVGEEPIDGALRELSEETGIQINKEDLTLIDTYLNKSRLESGSFINHFTYLYMLKKDVNIEDLLLQESEVSEAKFVNKEAFLKMMSNNEMVKGIEHCLKILDYMR